MAANYDVWANTVYKINEIHNFSNSRLGWSISVLDLCTVTVLAAELCYADALLWSVLSSCIYLGLTTTEHVHNTFVLALSHASLRKITVHVLAISSNIVHVIAQVSYYHYQSGYCMCHTHM